MAKSKKTEVVETKQEQWKLAYGILERRLRALGFMAFILIIGIIMVAYSSERATSNRIDAVEIKVGANADGFAKDVNTLYQNQQLIISVLQDVSKAVLAVAEKQNSTIS